MKRDEAAQLLAGAELVCPAEEVRAAVSRLAAEITACLKDEFPMVLAIMGGAVVFTGDHQRGHGDARQRRRTVAVGQDGHHLPRNAPGVKPAPGGGADALAQL